jgi:hypothetical protein
MIEITRAFLLVSLLGSQLDSIGVKAASGLGVNTVAYSQIGLFARHKKIVCVGGLVTA